MNRRGPVDDRAAAVFVKDQLGFVMRKANGAELSLHAQKGWLTPEELDAFKRGLDTIGVGSETLLDIVGDVWLLAATETPTTPGERPRLVLPRPDDATSAERVKLAEDAVRRRVEESIGKGKRAETDRDKRAPLRPTRRSLRRRLAVLRDAIEARDGVTHAPKTLVYLLYVVGGNALLSAALHVQPKDDETAASFTNRATKALDKVPGDPG